LSLSVAFFTTASGIYAMQAYAFDILMFSGLQHPRKLLPIIGWMKLAGALAAMALADVPQVGRRRLALCGGFICCACDLVLVVRLASPSSLPPNVAAVALFAFIGFWNAGYGGVQFASTLEMLPNEVRSVWAGQIFAIIGVVEISIYQLFELLLFTDGTVTFALFGAINFCSALFACFVMPDLGGRSLEVSTADLTDVTTAEALRAPSPKAAKASGGPSKAKQSRPRPRRYGKLDEELDDEFELSTTPHASKTGQASTDTVGSGI
jgi:hypothetical protein